MKLYNTVSMEAVAEQVIERSKFITYVKPVETKAEADQFIAEIKKKHRDATHNVPAMVIGEKMQIQWASDDGEPQGTSGAPMVMMMVNAGFTNLVVVVTRYFGGIKLGTGGLARAYTSSAKLGIEAACPCEVWEQACLTFSFDYTFLAKIQNMAGELYQILDIRYTDVVEADLACAPDKTAELQGFMTNLTQGKCILKNEEIRLVKKSLENF